MKCFSTNRSRNGNRCWAKAGCIKERETDSNDKDVVTVDTKEIPSIIAQEPNVVIESWLAHVASEPLEGKLAHLWTQGWGGGLVMM
jgi:hypothetical protein